MEEKNHVEPEMEEETCFAEEKKEKSASFTGKKVTKTTKTTKPFPNHSIEDALRIPQAIAQHNAGNPWSGEQLASALSVGGRSSAFYYLTASAREYGFITGTSRTKTIELTPLGRNAVFPVNTKQEKEAILQSFRNIELFQKLFDYYKGSALPDERFVFNVLQETLGLESQYHDEFIKIYRSNIEYLGEKGCLEKQASRQSKTVEIDTMTEENSQGESDKQLFVIMPFSEKTEQYPKGYFDEVFSSLIVPAAAQAGYTAVTANRDGSDIIHKTIVDSIYKSELILADLTEHNPNVLFELGLAIAFRKRVVIIRAQGTKAIFDIDNAIRVLDYDPRLWKSIVDMDVSKLATRISAIAQSNDKSYLDIFLEH